MSFLRIRRVPIRIDNQDGVEVDAEFQINDDLVWLVLSGRDTPIAEGAIDAESQRILWDETPHASEDMLDEADNAFAEWQHKQSMENY